MASWQPQITPSERRFTLANDIITAHDIDLVSPWRISAVNDVDRCAPDGSCVVYLMRRTQRGIDNPAVDVAIALANARRVPLVVVFRLGGGPAANNRRHIDFMLRGLNDTIRQIAERGCSFVLAPWNAPPTADVIRSLTPTIVVTDDDVMPAAYRSRVAIAASLDVPVLQVDNDVVVPGARFDRCEYAARTIRPRVHLMLEEHLSELAPHETPTTCVVRDERDLSRVAESSGAYVWNHQTIDGCAEVLDALRAAMPSTMHSDSSSSGAQAGRASLAQIAPIDTPSGPVAARLQLARFLADGLHGYSTRRNHPDVDGTSRLSHFLHYGHIAVSTIVHAARQCAAAGGCDQTDLDAFVEELVVRRELAHNYVRWNPQAASLAGAPAWARATLAAHASDPRESVYDLDQLAEAATHDPLWNAAQHQMMATGLMHGYVRMYWAKKILEWSVDPDTAFANALHLNDIWHLDGRDPSGIVGVAWAIAGVHDRPWTERPIFGTIRYMSLASTGRKFNSRAYINRWSGDSSTLF